MHKYNIIVLLIIFSYCVSFTQDKYNLNQCIELAIKNNPQIVISESALESNQSNLVISRSTLFPQISLQSTGSKTGGTSFIGPNAIVREYQNYSIGLQGQLMVFDFGRSLSKISSSSNLVSASEMDFKLTKQNLALATTIAYFNYLQGLKIKEVNLEIVQQSEEHFKQAKIFFEVGKKPEFDVIKADADLATAKLNLLRSENQLLIYKIQLENIIATKLSKDFSLNDDLEVSENLDIDLKNAVNIAYNSRPDLLSSLSKIEANKSLVTLAWTNNFPTLNLTGGYTNRSPKIDAQYLNGWNIGLNFTVPIFQGFALDAAIDQAKANLKSAVASNDLIIQQIKLDVEQQNLAVNEAKIRIDATKKLVKQSEEILRLAEGRYNSDVGSAIEVTDSRVALLNSKISYIQSLYDYHISIARFKKALGTIIN